MKRTLVLVLCAVLFAGTGLFAQQKTYKIGDKGPGGGIVFYAENGNYVECSTRNFGPITWDNAVSLVKTFNDGGYTDWRLPTGAELSLIYKNIFKKGLDAFHDSGYWSSDDSKNIAGSKWYVNFKNGYGGSKDPGEYIRCRYVRSF